MCLVKVTLTPIKPKRLAASRLKRGKMLKRKPAVLQSYNVATIAGGQQNPGEAQRGARRRLARLYEALRLTKNKGTFDPALVRKLWPSWHSAVSAEAVQATAIDELRSLKQQQAEQQRQESRRRL